MKQIVQQASESRAPLIAEVLGWAKTVVTEGNNIVFDTTNAEYFATVKNLLEVNGYHVLDVVKDKKAYTSQTPRLVYQATTADTAQTIGSLIATKLVDVEKCCALLDKAEGVSDLVEIAKENGVSEIPSICSAIIYDRWFRTVRGWIRMGATAKQIQVELDQTFNLTPTK
ncbi:hypothetical protein COY90_03525 [Candidatus Roizmanbacteria bacterium CG_4_10_14_0_8_um_filter_39_9]|uniref:Uncharacterized protein n=1 Tax=Candidatus Roizmanbacteria bacterium CG_4_10_14_0_8_um_filter_39_9 TaxID=1974829 RepID=A0A2M7QDE8_9BACT|nr:MAG: hypothetical protein COY90_03525 [Candidatus Roizmanbacteria bacterium CG_4_10_14_0_8_um_filter_39_9]